MTRQGQAGRQGADVRSDCHVACTLRDEGGIDLEIESKVATMFGHKIRKQVLDILADMNVAHATVQVQDGGALPFTLDARVEAAHTT